MSGKSTIGEVETRWRQRFEKAGILEPAESIKQIIRHVMGFKQVSDMKNVVNDTLNPQQLNELDVMCQKRLSRMPIQYVIGEWDFRDITIKLVPPIFVPWVETEVLVDVAIKRILPKQDAYCNVLEIGCGSGVITLSLAHACSQINVVAVDTNINACQLTLENAELLNLQDRVTIANGTLDENGEIKIVKIVNKGNCSADLKTTKFKFMVCNPPYVPTDEFLNMEPEIKTFQDRRALDAGKDGLKVIKPLLHYAAKTLQVGGYLFMEVHPSHPEYIKSFCSKNPDLKFKYENTYAEFCIRGRVVELVKLE